MNLRSRQRRQLSLRQIEADKKTASFFMIKYLFIDNIYDIIFIENIYKQYKRPEKRERLL